jgi:hypothetical protein
LKKIIDYWPLLTVVILYFGFCNLHFYYKEFNIDISSFVSTTDIFLGLFPQVVVLSTLIYGIVATSFYSELKTPREEIQFSTEKFKKPSKSLLWLKRNIEYIILAYLIFISILNSILLKFGHYKPYELREFQIITDILFFLIIYIGLMYADRKNIIYEKPWLLALFLLILIGQKIGTYRRLDALEIKDGITNKKKDHISFNYLDQKISSGDSILFVGQTSNYLFLYSMKDSIARIFPVDKLEHVMIK